MSAADLFEQSVRELRPEWAVVLGSGLAPFLHGVEEVATLPYVEVAGLHGSRVPGHAGRFVSARLADIPLLIAQGRVHLYEGHSAHAVTAGVRYLASLGVQRFVLTNAAGSLRPDFSPGSWMMLRDHLNLTGASPLSGGPSFVDLTEVYSADLRRHFSRAASAEEVTLHEGVYAGLQGPQYETPAEIRMLQTFGADAVGMSTVLEAIQARALGCAVAGFSCLTNYGAGLGAAPLSHGEVLQTSGVAAELFTRLMSRALRSERPKKTVERVHGVGGSGG